MGGGGGGGGTQKKPNFDEFFGTYRAFYQGSVPGKVITETIQINETIRFNDNDNSPASLKFDIYGWESAVTPSTYSSDYPNAFIVSGRITDAIPQRSDPPYLYGNKTAPGFTSADITDGTKCWMYLYFDDDKLIRTAFSKTGNPTENVITDNNIARIYRRQD